MAGVCLFQMGSTPQEVKKHEYVGQFSFKKLLSRTKVSQLLQPSQNYMRSPEREASPGLGRSRPVGTGGRARNERSTE